jgi:hypothetical protein
VADQAIGVYQMTRKKLIFGHEVETTSVSETLVYILTTRRYVEEGNICNYHCKNLRSNNTAIVGHLCPGEYAVDLPVISRHISVQRFPRPQRIF